MHGGIVSGSVYHRLTLTKIRFTNISYTKGNHKIYAQTNFLLSCGISIGTGSAFSRIYIMAKQQRNIHSIWNIIAVQCWFTSLESVDGKKNSNMINETQKEIPFISERRYADTEIGKGLPFQVGSACLFVRVFMYTRVLILPNRMEMVPEMGFFFVGSFPLSVGSEFYFIFCSVSYFL